jgi:hypothetical protein
MDQLNLLAPAILALLASASILILSRRWGNEARRISADTAKDPPTLHVEPPSPQ